jgi:hypothetical protein
MADKIGDISSEQAYLEDKDGRVDAIISLKNVVAVYQQGRLFAPRFLPPLRQRTQVRVPEPAGVVTEAILARTAPAALRTRAQIWIHPSTARVPRHARRPPCLLGVSSCRQTRRRATTKLWENRWLGREELLVRVGIEQVSDFNGREWNG